MITKSLEKSNTRKSRKPKKRNGLLFRYGVCRTAVMPAFRLASWRVDANSLVSKVEVHAHG